MRMADSAAGTCAVMLIGASVSHSPAWAQTISQAIQLRAGWNAVALEVDPEDRRPDAVFLDSPVDIAAHYFTPVSQVQYIRDPADAPWNEPGWGVWYAAHRPDAFLTSLHEIAGGRAYLVHSTSDGVWRLSGTVSFRRIRWRADSFNLVGFALDEQAPPTFDRFFSGAAGRIGRRVYRLDAAGKWRPVTAPATAWMRSGEAYWVYCSGRTDYQGPLDLRLPGLGEIDFGDSTAMLELEFRNNLSDPMDVNLEVVAGGGDLPLVRAVRDPTTLKTAYLEFGPGMAWPGLEGGGFASLRVGVRREGMAAAEQTRLLKLSSDRGVRFWIPVRARSGGIGP